METNKGEYDFSNDLLVKYNAPKFIDYLSIDTRY